MMNTSPKIAFLFAIILFFVGSLLVFIVLTYWANTDITTHARYISAYIENEIFPPNFLYYLTVSIVATFNDNIQYLLKASVATLAVALTAKYILSVSYATKWLEMSSRVDKKRHTIILITFFALQFVFCLPLPGQNWYLGQFPPSVWHNSTVIFLMPVVIATFYYSCKYLQDKVPGDAYKVTILILVGLLIKPSFFLAFSLTFPLFLLLKNVFNRHFVIGVLPVVIGGMVLLLQYYFIYSEPTLATINNEVMQQIQRENYKPPNASDGVELGWLKMWSKYSDNIFLSILNSLLLPIVVLLVYPKDVARDDRFQFSAGLVVISVLIFSLFYETGRRSGDGNFSWQMIINNYLLHFIVVLIFLKKKFVEPKFAAGDYFIISTFFVGVVSGLIYLMGIPFWGYK